MEVKKMSAKISNCNSWQWQMQNRICSLTQLKKLIKLSKEEEKGCKLPFSITPYYFDLIDVKDYNCPIRKQVIPHIEETIISKEEMFDPLGEKKTEPIKDIFHRYPDRVLFLVTNVCASYCRYCTRSRFISANQKRCFQLDFESVLSYIKQHVEIRDVLVSGGDPLLLSDNKLEYIISCLRAVKHVEIIRIGSRAPVFLPQRITLELCKMLKKYGPIWMSLHVNHPKECTAEFTEACDRLLCSKVILGNQSVLLRGVNDNASVMKLLCQRLLQIGVRPYYIYLCDLIVGSRHFRTSVEEGIRIIEQMRGHTSGYAVPQLVIDAPGGGGKIPINPNYIQRMTSSGIFLKNYKGDEYYYPNP